MIRPPKSQLQDVQKDPVDLELEQAMSTVDYYNRYVRKEGEKVLTQEVYDKILEIKKTGKGKIPYNEQS